MISNGKSSASSKTDRNDIAIMQIRHRLTTGIDTTCTIVAFFFFYAFFLHFNFLLLNLDHFPHFSVLILFIYLRSKPQNYKFDPKTIKICLIGRTIIFTNWYVKGVTIQCVKSTIYKCMLSSQVSMDHTIYIHDGTYYSCEIQIAFIKLLKHLIITLKEEQQY